MSVAIPYIHTSSWNLSTSEIEDTGLGFVAGSISPATIMRNGRDEHARPHGLLELHGLKLFCGTTEDAGAAAEAKGGLLMKAQARGHVLPLDLRLNPGEL